MLPLLGVLGLKARDIVGFTFIQLLVHILLGLAAGHDPGVCAAGDAVSAGLASVREQDASSVQRVSSRARHECAQSG